MNPLIRKEIRLLLPFLGIAIFLAVAPAFIVPGDGWVAKMNEIIFWALGFGAVLLGLAPFGQEFTLGTFPVMLAQPFERRRIWATKILLILFAGLLVLLAFMVAVHFRLNSEMKESLERFIPVQRPWLSPNLKLEDLRRGTIGFYHSEFWTAGLGGGAILIFVGLAGGFWTSLLFRQTGAALWFAILIPGIILVGTEVVSHFFLLPMNVFLIPALLVYAVAGFIWARRMFFSAQDAQWLGGTIGFLSLSPAKLQTGSAGIRRQKPLAALLRKEFQSHQVSLLIAFGLLVLHIATLFVRKFSSIPPNSELRFAVEAVPFLWLMLPWVIGSVAVAEERKLGTMEGQLCLPTTRRFQFTLKLFTALFLGIVLGGLMPCLIEGLGVLVHIPSEVVQPNSIPSRTYFATIGETLLASGIIAFISFYASTLTRNTLHALGMGVVLGGIFIALLQWLKWETGRYHFPLWRGPLIFVFVYPVWTIAVLWLSFSNYKRLHAGRKVWLQNLLVLAISLTCAGLTAAVVYQRPWELAMSLEPTHGPARLTGPVHPMICTPQNRIFVLLPDGRLWAGTDYEWKKVTRRPATIDGINIINYDVGRLPIPRSGTFIGGSNWVALAANGHSAEMIGLQSDGSLWNIISFHARTNFWKQWLAAVPQPHRIGSDNDWKSIAAGQSYFVAVKNDGTLWQWGFAGMGASNDARLRIDLPARIDTNSDWARVFSGAGSALLVKQNGDVWEWAEDWRDRAQHLGRVRANGADWLSADLDFRINLIIRQDHSLWALHSQGAHIFGTSIPGRSFQITDGVPQYNDNFVRIGQDTDWTAVTGGETSLYGLKTNGRLVKSGTELFSATLGRPSAYSDWLAINSYWDELTALSADGTISQWADLRPWDPGTMLLTSTHRPLWSLNIFTDSEN